MSSSDYDCFLDTVKACVHTGTFVFVSVFTYMTAVVIYASMDLKHNTYYFLLLQHCVCITGFHFIGAVVHGLCALHWPITQIFCLILFNLQELMACGLNITLALMCIFSCLSLFFPLQSDAIAWRSFRWVMCVVWMVTLPISVVCIVLKCTNNSWRYILADDTKCCRTVESQFCNTSTLLLLGILISLIVISYVLVFWECYHAGHFSWSIIKGQCTIFIHVLQISFHILPTIIIMSQVEQTLTQAIAIFLIRSISDALSPVIFGLRFRELFKKIAYHFPRLFPCCLNSSRVQPIALQELPKAATSPPSTPQHPHHPPTPPAPNTLTGPTNTHRRHRDNHK